ncbi:methyltransferase domain-containing protein [Ruegeria sp.]|uniref:methyltransferase domain-containing protein n=1 Tax=Ruegeria sp. TaxID=1879320 RepID=UPI00231FF2E8|nr:methyltransferase domain-containing protein [Ruegeria sp.]MDA7965040.1 methyltransferase domain-containing protein [Ruegeria sp.]
MTAQMTARVQRSFSRSFATYHAAAHQQARIAERLVQALLDGGPPQRFNRVLELGCGTGHLTQRVQTVFQPGHMTLNDLSAEAQQTAEAHGAAFLHGDARAVDWHTQPDLVASASMIQWLPDPAEFLRKAAGALAPGGWLAVSGFGPEQYRELVQIGSAAKAPGLCRAEDMAAAVRNDLEVVCIGETTEQMYFQSPRQVLEHLRSTGVNGRAQKAWTKSDLLRFTQDFTRNFGGDKGLPLTYHPVWLIARKNR